MYKTTGAVERPLHKKQEDIMNYKDYKKDLWIKLDECYENENREEQSRLNEESNILYEADQLIEVGKEYNVDEWIGRGEYVIEQVMNNKLSKASLKGINYYMWNELEEDELYDEIEAKKHEIEQDELEKERLVMEKAEKTIMEAFGGGCLA